MKNGALASIAITSSKSASDVSSIVPRGLIAALLTRMSTVAGRPSAASAVVELA